MQDFVIVHDRCNRPFGRPRLAVLILALIAVAEGSLSAAPSPSPSAPLRTAASILALSVDQARQAYPVQLQGVVTLPGVIQDETAGIWVNFSNKNDYVSGDLLEVRGTVGPGGYSPEVWPTSVRKIGHRELPHPKEVTFRELSAGNEDAQYVSIVGTVRSVRLPSANMPIPRIWLKVAMKDGLVDAALPNIASPFIDRLLEATIRLNAVALCGKNKNRQLTSVVLESSSIDQVKVLKPTSEDPFAAPLVSLGALMRYRSRTDYYHRVRVAGVVTYSDPGKRLILEEGEQAVLVAAPAAEEIQLGDRIEVSGFPSPENSGPILQDASVRFIEHGKPPSPAKVSVSDILSGASRYRLVSVEGRVVRRIDEPQGIELLVQSDSSLLQAQLEQPASRPGFLNFREGTRILVTGISLVEVEGTWDYAQSWVHCKLLLRSADDIQVLQLPSWWTTRRIICLATFFGILILILLGLVIYDQVARWKLQVVFRERERMAYEIHDTMAQSFAGIGFQLQAIMRSVPEGMPTLHQEVTRARDLVRHSQREARRSFSSIDSENDTSTDLLNSLDGCARNLIVGDSVEVTTSTVGVPCPIPRAVSMQLLRIGKEAIANAVRHANPRHLKILVEYAPDSIRLELQDDGIGFVKSGSLLGFGLRGMRRRAADIAAQLAIYSSPGDGTRIVVIAPLKHRRPGAWLWRMWNSVRGNFEPRGRTDSEHQA
jgi:signal transduction histidine kinase